MAKISRDEFYAKLRSSDFADAHIKQLWDQYESSGKLPMAVQFKLHTARSEEGKATPAKSTFEATGAGVASKEAPKLPSKTADQKRKQLGLPTGKDVPRGGKKSYGKTFAPPTVDSQGNRVIGKLGSHTPTPGKRGGRTPEPTMGRRGGRGIDDLGLGNLLGSLGALSEPISGDFSYQDFSGQANDIAARNFAPQYQALDLAQQGAQSQYNMADPIVKGLYEKLSGDIRNQAVQTGQSYDQQEAARAQAGQQQQQNIGQTYESTQANQAQLLAQLGIQDAAPATLAQGTNDSAWQQNQAGQTTQQQVDYLNNSGNAMSDYQNNIANAEQTQGAVARQGLIAQLSQALSRIGQDRLGVASEQSQTATQLAQSLADRDYSARQDQFSASRQAQKDAIDLAMQTYGLRVDADDRDYSRAQDDARMQLEVDAMTAESEMKRQELAAKLAQQGGTGIDFKDQGTMAKAATRMQQYGSQGIKALNLAQQVAGGNRARSRGEFIAMVVNAGQSQGIQNQMILIEAADQLADVMGFSRTGVDDAMSIT